MCIMNKVEDVHASKHWGEREKLLAVAVCRSKVVCVLTSCLSQLQYRWLNFVQGIFQISVEKERERWSIWQKQSAIADEGVLTCSRATPMKIPATTVRFSWSHFSNCGTQPLTLMYVFCSASWWWTHETRINALSSFYTRTHGRSLNRCLRYFPRLLTDP